MHIPNELINPQTAAGLGFAAASVLGFALSKVYKMITANVFAPAFAAIGNQLKTFNAQTKKALSSFGNEYLGKMSMLAALIFAAQMFNFPIASGTSGHLIGGTLAALFLGPWGGCLSISLVLIIQALFYGDGGMLALGANIVNMAIIGAVFSYYMLTLLQKIHLPKFIAISLTAWLAVVIAAAACALELAISGTYALKDTLPAMLKVHAMIGIAEALITIALVIFIKKVLDWKDAE